MIKNFFKKHRQNLLTAAFIAVFAAFCSFVLYSFVTIPFTGDIQVFMAAANQAKYQTSGGIMAIFEAWELKGIGNRLLMWIIYFLSDITVGYENKIAFSVAAKTVYAVFVIGALILSAYLWPTKDKKHKVYSFFAMFLAVFATYTSVQLQAEMTCVVLSLLSMACILHEKRWSLTVGGIIAATLMFYKSIFVLLFPVVLIGILIYDTSVLNKKKNLLFSIGAMVISEVVFAGLIMLVYPQEFRDMQFAAEMQHTLLSKGSQFLLPDIVDQFVNQFTQSSMAIPFLMIGVVSTILLAVTFAKQRDFGKIGLLILLWLLPIDLIVISNQYFQYHYFLLILPCMVSIITLLKYQSINIGMVFGAGALALAVVAANKVLGIVNASTVLLVLVHVLIFAVAVCFVKEGNRVLPMFKLLTLAVCLFFWVNFSSAISPKHQNLVALQRQSVSICDNTVPEDFADEPVLFLDAGTAPFYSDAPSYSRYFFNLPMQRWNEGNEWEVQAEEYKKLMEYDGKYIVFDNWFGIDKYPELKEKISNEYEPLTNGGLYFHSPSWDFFQRPAIPDAESVNAGAGCKILVRKGS